jgi:hypothetical protein
MTGWAILFIRCLVEFFCYTQYVKSACKLHANSSHHTWNRIEGVCIDIFVMCTFPILVGLWVIVATIDKVEAHGKIAKSKRVNRYGTTKEIPLHHGPYPYKDVVWGYHQLRYQVIQVPGYWFCFLLIKVAILYSTDMFLLEGGQRSISFRLKQGWQRFVRNSWTP